MEKGQLIQNERSYALMELIIHLFNSMVHTNQESNNTFCKNLQEHFPERDPGDDCYPQFVLDLENSEIGLTSLNLQELIGDTPSLHSMLSDVTHMSIFITNRTKNLHPVIMTVYGVPKLKEHLGPMLQKSAFSILNEYDFDDPQIIFPAFYHYVKKQFLLIKAGQNVLEFD